MVCLELLGHGESEGLDVSFAVYRDVLAALLEHLDIETADMCGLSKGARVGLDLAAQMPRRVRRLVVVNAFARLGPPDHLERA
ncbi:alpha/beta fold hydrolase [Stutzerimonas nitrititolerans]|uniref:alpha/beta fold hydrolase n=2 Tax=Pseudomonadota TaxID=1224 RepID=UPI00289732DC|nr:alpha/beta hydrolase [Stutzerimonas nitrititolerans]